MKANIYIFLYFLWRFSRFSIKNTVIKGLCWSYLQILKETHFRPNKLFLIKIQRRNAIYRPRIAKISLVIWIILLSWLIPLNAFFGNIPYKTPSRKSIPYLLFFPRAHFCYNCELGIHFSWTYFIIFSCRWADISFVCTLIAVSYRLYN